MSSASELLDEKKYIATNGQATCCPVPPGIQLIREGPGIEITGPLEEPTISNSGVLSVTTPLNSGIDIGGTAQNPTISNTGILTLTEGAGISITGGQNATITNLYVADVLGGTNIDVSSSGGLRIVNLQSPLTSVLNIGSQPLQNTASGTGAPAQLLSSTGTATQWANLGSIVTAGTNIDITGTTNLTVGLDTPLTANLEMGAVGIRDVSSTLGTLNQVLTSTSSATRWRNMGNLVTAGTGLSSTGGATPIFTNTGILDVSAGANITVTFPTPGTARVALSNPLTSDLNLGSQRVLDASGLPGTAGQVLTSLAAGGTKWNNIAAVSLTGFDASGGSKNTYISGGISYTAHTFTTPNVITNFVINSLGTDPNPTLDLLIVGGGGSGGGPQQQTPIINSRRGGGGGAGGIVYCENVALCPSGGTAPPFTLPVFVGAGGGSVTGTAGSGFNGIDGSSSYVEFPDALYTFAYPNPTAANITPMRIIAGGGSGGGGTGAAVNPGLPGYYSYLAGASTGITVSTGGGGGGCSGAGTITGGAGTVLYGAPFGDIHGFSFSAGGKQGGTASSVTANAGGGGGGARSVGFGSSVAFNPANACNSGGGGLRTRLDGTPRFIGGGGHGAGDTSGTIFVGTFFGGGQGYQTVGSIAAGAGTPNTGGGGGGGIGLTPAQPSGAGGSGIVIIRYRT